MVENIIFGDRERDEELGESRVMKGSRHGKWLRYVTNIYQLLSMSPTITYCKYVLIKNTTYSSVDI